MLNKVILIGNLGRDPEVRYMPNGEAVTNFSIATSESWNDKNTGQKVDRTEWHNIVLYGRLAEIAGQYLKKGRQVYIEGRIQSRKYTGKDGMERTAYEIIASEMKMLGSKSDSEQQKSSYTAEQYAQASGHRHSTPKPPQRQTSDPVVPVEPDDDIPF